MRTMQGFVPGVLCGDEDFVNLESIADGERIGDYGRGKRWNWRFRCIVKDFDARNWGRCLSLVKVVGRWWGNDCGRWVSVIQFYEILSNRQGNPRLTWNRCSGVESK